MNNLLFIRKELNITQTEIAEYLGISDSLISKNEKGERFLPDEAMQLSNELLDKLENLELLVKVENPIVDNKLWQDYANELAIKIINTEKKLRNIKQQFAAATKLYNIVTALQPKYARSKKYERQKLWLNAMQAKAAKKIADNNLPLQQILQLKINSWKEQQKQVKKMI